MKALAIVQGLGHVCARYRIEPFGWFLHERGISLELAPLARGTLKRLAQFRRARAYDVVILQRKCLPIWQLAYLRRQSNRLIYDVDDALFERDSYHRKSTESWTRLARFWTTVYAADAVTAGNGYLADRVAGYVGRDKVQLMPTCIEPSRYSLARHQGTGRDAKLVWIGQRSTLASLDHASRQMQAIARKLPGMTFRVICDHSPTIDGLRIETCRWSTGSEAADLAGADIGINWLPDDSWSRGKCGLRVLQYMAAGLPIVANPVGMNCEMVIDGRTGLLASTPDEWAEAVARLAADPALRRRLGQAGRQLVEQRFSVDAWGPQFARTVVDAVHHGCPKLHDVWLGHRETVPQKSSDSPSPSQLVDSQEREGMPSE